MRAMWRIALALLAFVAGAGCARTAAAPSDGSRLFTYAWRYGEGSAQAPRGGTTQGPTVTLDRTPAESWERLRDPDELRTIERDRRAILAMAGTYRVAFDFLEVIGFRPEYKYDRPYQSWATEYVYVVRDDPKFISLQHLLVMFVQGKDGKTEGPFVTKHWRQDWRYEDRTLVVYRGRNTWEKETLPASAVKGAWTQAVFQVDDSPRYEAVGWWEHFGNVSTWLSSRTWRPLPRREFSVRSDYDVLVGTNRITITPTGWVQEEENWKVTLDAPGAPTKPEPVLAKEVGLERFERVKDFDDSAAREYAERTEPFWREVRAAWDEIVASHRRFTLRGAPDRDQLFVPLFEYADKLANGAPFDRTDAARFARDTVRGYLLESDVKPARAPRRR